MPASGGPETTPCDGEHEARWYAVHTRARHEKKVARELQRANLETFLPTATETHSWSDRQKRIAVPLFSCYVFVRLVRCSEQRLTVMRAAGVNSIVGGNGGTPIPDGEIRSVRTALESRIPYVRCEMKKGKRVRVRGGVLDGVEGTLLSYPNERRLLISVGEINQSISLSV